MKSRGGKKEFLCPNCHSPKITKYKGSFQKSSGTCDSCNTWWPWSLRIKEKI